MLRRVLDACRGIEVPLIILMLLMMAGGIIAIRFMVRATERQAKQQARLRAERTAPGAGEDGPRVGRRRRQLA